MKKKIKILAPVLILIILAIGTYFLQSVKKSDELTLYGNIENRTVDVGFRIEGRIQKLFKEEGDAVKKNDTLAILDYVKYKALYEQSVADVDAAEAVREYADNLFQRHKQLCREGITSAQECNRIFNQNQEAEAKLESAEQRSKAAKDNLDNTVIYSPCDGIVTVRIREEGSVVSPSMPVYSIAISEPVWIRAFVSEKDLGNIKYKMPAYIYTDTVNPDTKEKKVYSGYIGYISPVAEFTPKTVQTTDLRTDLVYRIRVYVDKTDDFLRQGMPVTIKIPLADKENGNENNHNYKTDNPFGITEYEESPDGYR